MDGKTRRNQNRSREGQRSMKNYCQMITDNGLIECGFLVGAKCKANPNHPFIVDRSFHDNIKIVGCQSWGRYLDYGSRQLKESAVSELPLPEMERSGRCEQAERDETISMPVLQTGSDCQRDSQYGRLDGSNVTCISCKSPAVTSDCGHYYCASCAKRLGLI